MSGYQLHSNEDMVSGIATDVGSFGSSAQSGIPGLNSAAAFGPVRPASGSRGRSLTPNPLPNGGLESGSLLQSLFAPTPPKSSPNVSLSSMAGSSYLPGGMANAAAGRPVSGSGVLTTIFPSSTTAVSGKDTATVNHILGLTSAPRLQKSPDLSVFGSGMGLGATGGGIGLSENDFPCLSTNASTTPYSVPPPATAALVSPPGQGRGGFGPISGGSAMGVVDPANLPAVYQQQQQQQQQQVLSLSRTTGMLSVVNDAGAVGGNFAGLMKTSDAHSEFQINNEDFPALPLQGAPEDTRPGTFLQPLTDGPSAGKDGKMGGDLGGGGKEGEGGGGGPGGQSGIMTSPDGTVSNIPSGMIRDQFGMVGMLTFLRALETHPSIVSLALGTELTHLGLNLNAPARNLYQTFAGPWMETPCRPQDLDWHVPQEYITNPAIRERLSPIKLNRYSDDLLFFIFYMCTGESFQLAAAIELYKRDWRYCKEDRFWITRPQGMPPQEKTDTYERGMYYIFDPHQWRKFPREMVLHYAKLEQLDIPASQQSSVLQSFGGM